ncbi:hypothetical protein Pint_09773 [Pistacia integerrima]|uniref:Uncharacterized protein n=2 Tax=Pistacia TaxID=55512 RepID=A0ACC1A441_9ROSI|nr:hypothetical protein Pint_09773 [Pistacia integerrima]KAJ0081812.1 hypothetical protein Patl1_09898 [Pistacia atlantica]
MSSEPHESFSSIRLLASLKASLCFLFASQIFLINEKIFPSMHNPIHVYAFT